MISIYLFSFFFLFDIGVLYGMEPRAIRTTSPTSFVHSLVFSSSSGTFVPVIGIVRVHVAHAEARPRLHFIVAEHKDRMTMSWFFFFFYFVGDLSKHSAINVGIEPMAGPIRSEWSGAERT